MKLELEPKISFSGDTEVRLKDIETREMRMISFGYAEDDQDMPVLRLFLKHKDSSISGNRHPRIQIELVPSAAVYLMNHIKSWLTELELEKRGLF